MDFSLIIFDNNKKIKINIHANLLSQNDVEYITNAPRLMINIKIFRNNPLADFAPTALSQRDDKEVRRQFQYFSGTGLCSLLEKEITRNTSGSLVINRFLNNFHQVRQKLMTTKITYFLESKVKVDVNPAIEKQFFWLLFRILNKERINFKIGVLTNKALNGPAPSYLWGMLVPVAVNPALRRNRSTDRGDITCGSGKEHQLWRS